MKNQCDLASWINLENGNIISENFLQDENLLLQEVHRKVVADLFGKDLLHSCDPNELISELHIKLSEKIVPRETKLHPGIAGMTALKDPFGISVDKECFYQEDRQEKTREKEEKHSFILLGEFKASRKENSIGTIYLYTKAIASRAQRKVTDFETVFWATLAHEVFHAFHFCQMKQAGKEARWQSFKKADRELVKESLAAYFEYLFLDKQDARDPYRELLRDAWECRDVEGWPYSGALGILKSQHSKDLFELLFEMSFSDWKTAADIIRTGYYMSNHEIAEMFR